MALALEDIQKEFKAAEAAIATILSKIEHDGIKFKDLTVNHVIVGDKLEYKVSITADISGFEVKA